MYRSAACERGLRKTPPLEGDEGSDEGGDSSKENSLVDSQNQLSSIPSPASKSVEGSPWGHTLTPKSVHQRLPLSGVRTPEGKRSALRSEMASSSPNTSLSPTKPSVPWNDLSFAAEVLSPGFTDRVVRAAHSNSQRVIREGRRHYPTAQERYVRAGVLPNVRLSGRTKAVLTPRRVPPSPLFPLGRSPSAFSTSLSSDFLSSATPRMPDIRSVASVLEPVSTSSECVCDPTSVQAVVAALQQAQAGKGVKRGSCYMEAEDLSKRQRCSTPGNGGNGAPSSTMPINYSRDYTEDNLTHGGNGGGEKRALDLSPNQGSQPQISPENKRRCVLDPMHASLSSSKFLDMSKLQGSGRDTPYSMYDSRQDTDSESNRSVESGHSKASEQSLHQQTSEATIGESCVISPGPSERDLSDRSGSHTPQSTRGESWNGVACVNGGTANTSRTSTPRNATPPQHNHVISLEAYKAEKNKSQQRLKKMLGMLFHVTENEETQSIKSGTSTPASSTSQPTKSFQDPVPLSTSSNSTLEMKGQGVTLLPSKTSSEIAPSSSIPVSVTEAETSKSEVTTTFTFSLKPSSSSSQTDKVTLVETQEKRDSEKEKDSSTPPVEETGNVSVSAILKLPLNAGNAVKQPVLSPVCSLDNNTQSVVSSSVDVEKPSSLVDFLKTSSPSSTTSSGATDTIAANPILQSRLSMPSQISVSPSTPIGEMNPLLNIPAQTLPASTGTSEAILGSFSTVKSQASVSSPPSGGFTFSTSGSEKSAFSFGVSSSPNTKTVNSSNPLLSQSLSSPFTAFSSAAEKLSSTSNVTSAGTTGNGNDLKTPSSPTGMFTFGSGASKPSATASSGFTSSAPLPVLQGSSTSAFSIPSGTISTTSTSSIFAFGAPKTTPAATTAVVSSPGQSSGAPGLVFNFGASTQAASSTSTSTSLSQSNTSSTVLSSTTEPTTAGFVISAAAFGAPPKQTATPNLASPPPSSVPPSTQPPPYNFGQLVSQASTTASSGFNFPPASQATASPALFQFGSTPSSAAPTQDNKGMPGQLFPSTGVTSQGNMASSSPFTFGSGSTNATTTSPFTFNTSKTDNSAPPAFGSNPDSSVKTSMQSGFNFNPTTAVTTNAFNSVTSATATNAFSSTTNTSSTPSAGFNFGSSAAAAAPSGFSFGAASKTPATSTTASPFTFGSSAAKPTSFGAPPTSTASPFNFGSSAASAPTPTFGSNPGQGFGPPATSTSTFGTATPTFGGSNTAAGATSFGSANAAPGATSFGSANPAAGATSFGSANPAAGATSFGSANAAAGAASFGSANAAAGAASFGSANAAAGTASFGSANAAAGAASFGSANAFGATSPQSSFGSNTFGAGANSGQPNNASNPFGNQARSLAFGMSGNNQAFGTPGSGTPAAAPSFGQPAGANSTTPAFGTANAASATPAFGTASSTTPAAPTFGSSSTATPSTFGAAPPPSFGASFGSASTSTGNNNNNSGSNCATSPFQFGQGAANPAPSFGLATPATPGGPVFQFGSAPASPFSAGALNFGVSPMPGDQQNVFNVGNPGTGAAPRRPRTRAPRRHR